MSAISSEIPDNVLFLIELTDAYSWRNLIDYLRCSNTEGNFIFSKKEISYKAIDGQNYLLNHVKIKTHKLFRWIFNSESDILVGIQLTEMQSNTKNIGKKDGMRMYLKPNDPNIYMQILSTTKGPRGNISFVKTREIDFLDYEPPEYLRPKDEPNSIAIISDFAKTCKMLSSVKCDYVILQGYPKGVKMSAYLEGHLVGKSESFGTCEDAVSSTTKLPDIRSIVLNMPDVDPNMNVSGKKVKILLRPVEGIPTIRVPSSIIGYLSKTNNTSQNGIVMMYLEDGKPARFVFPVGYYGKLSIYIRDQTVSMTGDK